MIHWIPICFFGSSVLFWIGNGKEGNSTCCYKCFQADLSQAMTDNKPFVPIQNTEREHFVCSGKDREKDDHQIAI